MAQIAQASGVVVTCQLSSGCLVDGEDGDRGVDSGSAQKHPFEHAGQVSRSAVRLPTQNAAQNLAFLWLGGGSEG